MIEREKTWIELRNRLRAYVGTKVAADIAEDLVHDILLRVLKNEEKLSAVDDPLAWIYTIARNRITDHYRKQSRNIERNDPQRVQAEHDSCESMPECVDIDFASWLRPVAERLEPKYREALLLVDFGQKGQAIAAEQAGISLSAMKSRVQRARAILKDEILACCAIEVDRFGKPVDYAKRAIPGQDRCC